MKKQFFLGLSALALLASCSNDHEGLKGNLYDGYLHVNGTINEIKTRATDQNFSDGDEIGVTGGTYTNVQYTFNSNAFASTSGIKVTADGASFTAYYPYDSTLSGDEIEFRVADETDNTPVEGVDFMFADSQTASADEPEVNFSFSHKMSQISLTIVDKTTDSELSGKKGSITISDVATTGKFNVTNGTVTPDDTDGKVIVSDVTPGTAATVILPSYATANSDAVKVVVAINDKTYTGTVTPAFAAGTRYVYTLNITDSAVAETEVDLSIDSAEVTDWNPTINEEIAMAEDYVLQVGDFLLKSGKTIAPTAANAAANSGNIVGVVYYVGNPHASVITKGTVPEEQDILKKNCPDCVNGLAIAINNAHSEAYVFADSKYNFYTAWFNVEDSKDPETANYYGNYLNLTTAGTLMIGYNNTKAMEQAGTYAGGISNVGMETTFGYLSNFKSSNSVTGASDWYIPSYGEFKEILRNYNIISSAITKAGGTLQQFSDFEVSTASDNGGKFYWTSDLRGQDYAWVSPLYEVDETNGGDNKPAGLYPNKTSKANTGYLRLAIAF